MKRSGSGSRGSVSQNTALTWTPGSGLPDVQGAACDDTGHPAKSAEEFLMAAPEAEAG